MTINEKIYDITKNNDLVSTIVINGWNGSYIFEVKRDVWYYVGKSRISIFEVENDNSEEIFDNTIIDNILATRLWDAECFLNNDTYYISDYELGCFNTVWETQNEKDNSLGE